MGIYKILKKEYMDYKQIKPKFIDIVKFYYNSISFRTLVTIRIMKMYSIKGKMIRANFYKNKLVKFGIEVGLETEIGEHLMIPHPNGIVIGKGCRIGNECRVYQNVTIGRKNGGYPEIGDNVTIYPGAIVVGDIRIGNNVVIGANAVVLQSLPDNAIAAGIPADVIRIE